MNTVEHLTLEQLEAGLEHIRQSPKDVGVLKLISRRPNTDEREVVDEAQLDPAHGLVGDNWKARGSRSSPDGIANYLPPVHAPDRAELHQPLHARQCWDGVK